MMDLAEILHAYNQVSEKVRKLVDLFISCEGRGCRYVLGRNEHSDALSKVIELDGVVDDFAEPGAVWNGKPILKGINIPPCAIVINCSMSISPVSAARRLANLNIAGVLAISDIWRVLPDFMPLPLFVDQTRRDLVQNFEKWKRLEVSLADDQSKKVLEDVLRYRTTGDYRFMRPYSVRFRDQYFEDFLGLTLGEVFVDAGGFDGDTTEEFVRRCPNYGKVILFEPSCENIQKARIRLSGSREVEFVEKGLSDTVGVLSFNPNSGSASSVSDTGSCQINVTTLDVQVQEIVSFIKMDLEGWEMKALAGACRHIHTDHPKLAIAVYHQPNDFWKVFELVMGMRCDYKVYLRHYTEGWSETVMFFVPMCKTSVPVMG